MDKKYISDNKRVILITGDSGKWYEQAIFIVKKNAAAAENIDFIGEAEKIISHYMKAPESQDSNKAKDAPAEKRVPTAKQKTVFDTVVNVLIIIAASTLLTLLLRGL